MDAVACSEIFKPIIAEWKCTPPITNPYKITSNFSCTVNMSKYSTTFVSNYLYRETTFVLQLFYINSTLYNSNTAIVVPPKFFYHI